MPATSLAFPTDYAASRARFRGYLEQVRARWPGAQLAEHRLAGDEDLTIDWLSAPPLEGRAQALVFTTGEHGIEAFLGSAMLDHFVQAYLPRLDPRRTGLLLVHAINPWGMRHRRRVNRDNIDLNRTFLLPPTPDTPVEALHDPRFNPEYRQLRDLLEPTGPFGSYAAADVQFLFQWLAAGRRLGFARAGAIGSLGQYAFPQGIHYGGVRRPEETGVLMDLYRQCFEAYDQVVQLDMHTGYGPRYLMQVVTSEHEPRHSADLQKQFNYPMVVKATASEFYALRGDMIDYVYLLWRAAFPERRLFSATYEFGTLGHTRYDEYRSRQAMVFENRLYHFGAARPAVRAWVERDFKALFYPDEPDWCVKALADFDQATEGILRAEEVLTPL